MKRAFIYLRKSTGKQEMSIETQRQHLKEYCEENDIEIVDTFIDEGVSGRLKPMKRKAMKCLLEEINKTIDYVIVFKLDRISRDVDHIGFIETYISDYGANIKSTFEQENDKKFRAIFGFIAEQESENISQRIKAGKKMQKLKGEYLGGTSPFGYETLEGSKQLFISEDESIIIKMVFNMRKRGMGMSAIAKKLNEAGYRNREGNKFHDMTIKRILDRKDMYRGKEPYAPAII